MFQYISSFLSDFVSTEGKVYIFELGRYILALEHVRMLVLTMLHVHVCSSYMYKHNLLILVWSRLGDLVRCI